MKSIRSKLGFAYVAMILALWLVIGSIAFVYVRKAILVHSAQSMNFLLDQKFFALNSTFEALSDDVRYLKDYIEQANSFDDDFYSLLRERACLSFEDQRYVKSFFFCPEEEETCLFLLDYMDGDPHNKPSSKYSSSLTVTGRFFDVSFKKNSPKKSGKDYVPWLSLAKSTGGGIWFGPYKNYNLEQMDKSIAYFEPVFLDDKFMGVVGIEINSILLRKLIDTFSYGDAFTILVGDKGDIIYHKDFQGGIKSCDFSADNGLLGLSKFFSDGYADTEKSYKYIYKGERHRIVLRSLRNGMLLALSVPEKQLFALQETMLLQMAILFMLSLLVTFVIVSLLTHSIVRPIEIITEATNFIAHGELKTKIPVKSNDELGILASQILKIEGELSEYIEHIRSLAYTDFMTACKNKSAYLKKLSLIEKRIAEDIADFTVYVFDVNGLKRINDTKGHELGDELIKAAAGALKSTFSEDDIFRTGGDEFVVIEEGTGSDAEKNLATFEQAVADFNAENKLSFTLAVSAGFSKFEKGIDRDFKTVATRADYAMYDAKEAYYKTHEDMRRK